MPEQGTVIIRAHGIAPEIRRKIENTGVGISDATCLYVLNVQNIISKYANMEYAIIIVGDKGHAEVEAYMGYACGRGIVVEGIAGLNLVPLNRDKYCVVSQTTQDKQVFDKVIGWLKKISKEA
mgnify:CR=1 FL=1